MPVELRDAAAGALCPRGCGGRDTYENDGGCMTRHSDAVMDDGMQLCEVWVQKHDTEGMRERRAASVIWVRVRKWWRRIRRNAGLHGAHEQHGWKEHVRGVMVHGEVGAEIPKL